MKVVDGVSVRNKRELLNSRCGRSGTGRRDEKTKGYVRGKNVSVTYRVANFFRHIRI